MTNKSTIQLTNLNNFVRLVTKAIAVLDKGDDVNIKAGSSTVEALKEALSVAQVNIKRIQNTKGRPPIDPSESTNLRNLLNMRRIRAKRKEQEQQQ